MFSKNTINLLMFGQMLRYTHKLMNFTCNNLYRHIITNDLYGYNNANNIINYVKITR